MITLNKAMAFNQTIESLDGMITLDRAFSWNRGIKCAMIKYCQSYTHPANGSKELGIFDAYDASGKYIGQMQNVVISR